MELTWELSEQGSRLQDFFRVYRAENAFNAVPACQDHAHAGWTKITEWISGSARSFKVYIPDETDPTAFTMNSFAGTMAVNTASCYSAPMVQAPTKIHNALNFQALWAGGNSMRCLWNDPYQPVTGLQLEYRAVYANGSKGPAQRCSPVLAPTREIVLSGLDATAVHFEFSYRTYQNQPGQASLFSDWGQRIGYLAWSSPQELVQVAPACTNLVYLTWKEMYVYKGAFDLERSEDGGQSFKWVKTVPACSTGLGIYPVSAIDATCAPGKRYIYRVLRQDSLRIPSPVTQATTRLPAPTSVQAEQTSTGGQVRLNWIQPATDIRVDRFRITRRVQKNGVWQPEEFVNSVEGSSRSALVPAIGGGMTPQVWKISAEAYLNGPDLTSCAGQSNGLTPLWIVVVGF